MTVRGKFRVSSINKNYWNTALSEIKLDAVYSSTPEDNTYSVATPNGSISLSVTNQEAAAQFVLGSFMYVDFTPITEVN